MITCLQIILCWQVEYGGQGITVQALAPYYVVSKLWVHIPYRTAQQKFCQLRSVVHLTSFASRSQVFFYLDSRSIFSATLRRVLYSLPFWRTSNIFLLAYSSRCQIISSQLFLVYLSVAFWHLANSAVSDAMVSSMLVAHCHCLCFPLRLRPAFASVIFL